MRYSRELIPEALILAAKPGMTVAQVEPDLGKAGIDWKRQRYCVDENSNEL